MEHNNFKVKSLISALLITLDIIIATPILADTNFCSNYNPTEAVFAGCVYGTQTYDGHTYVFQQISSNFNTLEDAINYYKEQNLQTYFPGIDFNKSNLTLNGIIYLGGMPVYALYETTEYGSVTTSAVQIHTMGADDIVKNLTLSYKGADGNMRSISFQQQTGSGTPLPNIPTTKIEDQLKDFAKGDTGQNFLTGLLQARVAESPIDPVAGNPVSYMARLIDNDYDLAIEGHQAGEHDGGLTLFGVTPQYQRTTLASLNVSTYDLPLRYNHFFNNTNNLIVDMPITMQTLNQTNTYSVGLGAAYSHFFLPHWSLMPAFHVGAVGSLDLGSATLLYDGALASRVTVPLGAAEQYILGMTNDVSYLKTQSITVAQYTIAYKLSNWLTKNGVDFNYIMNNAYSVGTYFDRVDKVSGNRWYVSDYNEIGVKSSKVAFHNGAQYNFLTMTLGYLFGPAKFSGVNVSFGINF